VLRPHQSLEELAEHEMERAFAVGAFDGERLVAVGYIGPEGGADEWRVRGMATEPGSRGRGAGAAVLTALIAHAEANRARRVWCTVRTPARSFYQRAGFRAVGEEYVEPDTGPHAMMELITRTR
jgi:GNAT superfamily N-acetyltransferase